MPVVFVAVEVVAVVELAPATWVVVVQVVPIALGVLTTSEVAAVNHILAEQAASLGSALLLVAIPAVRGLS